MNAKTALRGPNASAGPFAISTANAARPRFRSTQPLSLTGSGQYELQCKQSIVIHPWTSGTGSGHQHPRHPDNRRMCVQKWLLNIAELLEYLPRDP